MMPFFNRTGLERVGVVRPELGCCWTGLPAPYVAFLWKKNKKEEEPVGASPVAALLPKSVSF